MKCIIKHCKDCKPVKAEILGVRLEGFSLEQVRAINAQIFGSTSNGSTEYHPEQLTQHPEFETFTRDGLR
jgi:hypothetical protein